MIEGGWTGREGALVGVRANPGVEGGNHQIEALGRELLRTGSAPWR